MSMHQTQAAGAGYQRSLVDQLANVGSEVGRIIKWRDRNPELSEKAFIRALELMDLTIGDPRWRGRRKELTRARTHYKPIRSRARFNGFGTARSS